MWWHLTSIGILYKVYVRRHDKTRQNWAECYSEKHAKNKMGVIFFFNFLNWLIFVNFDVFISIYILRNCYKNGINIYFK